MNDKPVPVNRLDRLYALVQELTEAAPRRRTVPSLAASLQVSERTVQRYLHILAGAGLPVSNEFGRGGGWSVDGRFRVLPLLLSGPEVLVLVVALAAADDAVPLVGPARRVLSRASSALSPPAAEIDLNAVNGGRFGP